MNRKRILKYGAVLCSVSLAAYYRQEVNDVSVGVLRFGRAAFTVGQIMLDYNKSLYSGRIDTSSEEYDKAKSEVHLRSAQRLLKLCEVNGGAFIKVGQHLGALDYLIPSEYVNTMKVLHSSAPQSSYEEVLAVLREDLKEELFGTFKKIDEKPLGAASLAQVHKAELKDGRIVAVKVQHPLVKAYSQVDMKSMEFLVNIVSWAFPDFKLHWLVKETKRNLPLELDFTMEGKNSEKAAKLLNHLPWLHVPKIHWDLSTSRVLTMEYCNGINVGDIPEEGHGKFDDFKKDISRKVTQLYSDMIFLHGFVHCDPHPGNLRVDLDSKGRLILHLLDHGLYTELPEDFRENYTNLWMSIVRANVDEMRQNSEKLGIGQLFGLFACMVSGRSWNAILGGIDKQGKTTAEANEIKNDASKYVKEIMEVLHSVPREMLLIFKTNDLLRGLDSMLGVSDNVSSFVTMSRSCAQASYFKEYYQCSSFICKCRANLYNLIAHVRISIYQLLLWWSSLWSLRQH